MSLNALGESIRLSLLLLLLFEDDNADTDGVPRDDINRVESTPKR